MRKFKLWNNEMNKSFDLSNQSVKVSEVSGLGNKFSNEYYDADNANKYIKKQRSDFEDISLLINFGIKSNAYKDYTNLINFIGTFNKDILVLEYTVNGRTVYTDVALKNAPKSQRNEYGIIAETFLFDRLTPFYTIVKEENLDSYVLTNKFPEDIKPKVTIIGNGKAKLSYVNTKDSSESKGKGIIGVTGILTAANGELTRTDLGVGATTNKIINGDFTEVHNTLDNYWPYNEIVETTYKNQHVILLPLVYKYLDGNTVKIAPNLVNSDYIPHPLFVEPDGSILPYKLLYKYNFIRNGNNLNSVPGVQATTSISLNEVRSLVGSMGPEYSSLDWKVIDYLQTLFQVQYATINSQSVFRGRVDSSTRGLTGATNGAAHKCAINNLTSQYKLWGIEDPSGNIYELVDGIIGVQNKNYICYDVDKYHSSDITNYVEHSDWLRQHGYITKLNFNSNHKGLQLPSVLGGSSSAYYGDYNYTNPDRNNTTAHIYIHGANWGNGSHSGLWYWYSHWSGSSTYTTVGGRLLINPFKGG